MSATEFVQIGEALPVINAVSAAGPASVTVSWVEGPRAGIEETVDLAPIIFTHKVFAPLRANPELFETVHVIDDGDAIAWGSDDAIELAAVTIERLAEEVMSRVDSARS